MENGQSRLTAWGRPLERGIYRLAGIDPQAEMGWKRYALAVLAFNILGIVAVYALQRLQGLLPLNPAGMGAVSPDSSLNTAISFVANTNWQGYGGESTMSYLTQMLALTVQNFVSAATGIAVLFALIRGLARHCSATLGNFWADMVRCTLYVLLPLSLVLALALVSQGVLQNFNDYQEVQTVEALHYDQPRVDAQGQPVLDAKGQPVTDPAITRTQTLAMGPVASQEAIKMLGTNGGGFFNANSAHPFENPTALSNFLEMLAILVIPAALCFSFGEMVGSRRQGIAILAAMTLLFAVFALSAAYFEQQPNPMAAQAGADSAMSVLSPGGNMEGKETRFGIAATSLFATVTTAASCGAVNGMHDSLNAMGGLTPMLLMQLGEVVYGGVGSGLYGMLAFAILGVFIAGLMIGRTPEYLGKKIEAYDMKMVSIVILATPLLVLGGTALAVSVTAGRRRAEPRHPRLLRGPVRPPRPPTTTAAPSPASRPTRPSTTCCWEPRCGSAASPSSLPCWLWPARWGQAPPARRARQHAHHGPPLRRAADRRGAAGGRPDLCARAGPGPGRGTPATLNATG